jgi:hypothetical protein
MRKLHVLSEVYALKVASLCCIHKPWFFLGLKRQTYKNADSSALFHTYCIRILSTALESVLFPEVITIHYQI